MDTAESSTNELQDEPIVVDDESMLAGKIDNTGYNAALPHFVQWLRSPDLQDRLTRARSKLQEIDVKCIDINLEE